MPALVQDIQGLREQIIASAATAYPHHVNGYLERNNTKIIKPSEIFDVIVTADTAFFGIGCYRAVLVTLSPEGKTVVQKTDSGGLNTALEDLLFFVGKDAKEALGL